MGGVKWDTEWLATAVGLWKAGVGLSEMGCGGVGLVGVSSRAYGVVRFVITCMTWHGMGRDRMAWYGMPWHGVGWVDMVGWVVWEAYDCTEWNLMKCAGLGYYGWSGMGCAGMA